MVGKNQKTGPPRASLNVPKLAKEYRIDVAMGVNNVQNPFTPQGSVDPLGLCTLGVAIFQAGTPSDCRSLLVCYSLLLTLAVETYLSYGSTLTQRAVTRTSKQAIGLLEFETSLLPHYGDPADFVILHDSRSVQQAVLSPSYDRTTIKAGRVIAGRRSHAWTSLSGAGDGKDDTNGMSYGIQNMPRWTYVSSIPLLLCCLLYCALETYIQW